MILVILAGISVTASVAAIDLAAANASQVAVLAASLGLAAFGGTALYLERRFKTDGNQANIAMTPCILALLGSIALLLTAGLAMAELVAPKYGLSLAGWFSILAGLAPLFSGRFDIVQRIGRSNTERIERKWISFDEELDALEVTLGKLPFELSSEMQALRQLTREIQTQRIDKSVVMKLRLKLNRLNAYADVATVTVPVLKSNASDEDHAKVIAPTREAIRTALNELMSIIQECEGTSITSRTTTQQGETLCATCT